MTTPTGDAYTQVRDALSTDPDKGQTAREVATLTGVGYSRVTELLRELADQGVALKAKSGRQVTWTRTEHDAAVTTEPSQTAATASEGDTHPDAPATGPTAATDTVTGADGPDGTYPLVEDAPVVPLADAQTAADVLGAMTAVRPIPDAPAKAEKAPRTRTAGPAREVRNDFGSGGLQGAVLRYMDEHKGDDGKDQPFGPYELAQALSAHASSVAYSLKRTTAKGQTVDVTTDGKPRFRLATSAEASAHARRVADAKAAETAATAPAS